MKLLQVWAAQKAMQKLTALDIHPERAYELLTFKRKFFTEVNTCEEMRCKIGRAIAKVGEGEGFNIPNGTSDYDIFIQKFGKFLEGECALAQCTIKFEDLLKAIGGERNTISADDLDVLEPLFKGGEIKEQTPPSKEATPA